MDVVLWDKSDKSSVRSHVSNRVKTFPFPKREDLAGMRVEPDLRANGSRPFKATEMLVTELLGAVEKIKKVSSFIALVFFFPFLTNLYP